MDYIGRTDDLVDHYFLFVIAIFSGIMLNLNYLLGGYGHRFEDKIPALLEGSH
jgi:hypothetical protein